jgi:hypothetical protein
MRLLLIGAVGFGSSACSARARVRLAVATLRLRLSRLNLPVSHAMAKASSANTARPTTTPRPVPVDGLSPEGRPCTGATEPEGGGNEVTGALRGVIGSLRGRFLFLCCPLRRLCGLDRILGVLDAPDVVGGWAVPVDELALGTIPGSAPGERSPPGGDFRGVSRFLVRQGLALVAGRGRCMTRRHQRECNDSGRVQTQGWRQTASRARRSRRRLRWRARQASPALSSCKPSSESPPTLLCLMRRNVAASCCHHLIGRSRSVGCWKTSASGRSGTQVSSLTNVGFSPHLLPPGHPGHRSSRANGKHLPRHSLLGPRAADDPLRAGALRAIASCASIT